MTTHTIRFFRQTVTGEHVAICTCGRTMTGALDTVQSWAACHDLDDMSVPEYVPFASGLETK